MLEDIYGFPADGVVAVKHLKLLDQDRTTHVLSLNFKIDLQCPNMSHLISIPRSETLDYSNCIFFCYRESGLEVR